MKKDEIKLAEIEPPDGEKPEGVEIPELDENFAEQIREMLDGGYSAKDILGTGLYKESTVRQEVRRRMKREGKPSNHNGATLPVKLEKGNFIPIEAELEGIRLSDGEYRIGFIDGLRVLILGVKLSQMLTANLSETTASQLALLKEAKSDSKEVAQETVLEILPHIADMLKEASRAASPNPIAGVFSRMLESTLTPVMGNLMSMFKLPGQPQGQLSQGQSSLPTGWSDSSKGEK